MFSLLKKNNTRPLHPLSPDPSPLPPKTSPGGGGAGGGPRGEGGGEGGGEEEVSFIGATDIYVCVGVF